MERGKLINMTEKHIKRPIEVQAVQFTNENKDQVYSWAAQIQNNVYHDWDDDKNPILVIPTLEGEMKCEIGDYIIVEPFPTDWRKLYPCKAEIFHKTYQSPTPEAAGEEEAAANAAQEYAGRFMPELRPQHEQSFEDGFLAASRWRREQGRIKPGYDVWSQEALNLLHWSSLGADVLKTMCEKVSLEAGAEKAKELSESIKSFLENPSQPPKLPQPCGARWVMNLVEKAFRSGHQLGYYANQIDEGNYESQCWETFKRENGIDESTPCPCDKELQELREWKEKAINDMVEFHEELGRELGINDVQHDKILPAIKGLKTLKGNLGSLVQAARTTKLPSEKVVEIYLSRFGQL